MVRKPCCGNMGLKKGQWTPEEDQILISYIQRFGHANWRALPKQAGLMRCGKSCRLRWTNYLRPDIKRGHFSVEEEVTIIKLHHIIGNRWSTIAARLPGRTDNEIKNYWHIKLKKKAKQVHDQEAFSSLTGSSSSKLSNPILNTTILSNVSDIFQNSLGKMSSNLGESMESLALKNSSLGPVSPAPLLKVDDYDDVLLFWYNLYRNSGESIL